MLDASETVYNITSCCEYFAYNVFTTLLPSTNGNIIINIQVMKFFDAQLTIILFMLFSDAICQGGTVVKIL